MRMDTDSSPMMAMRVEVSGSFHVQAALGESSAEILQWAVGFMFRRFIKREFYTRVEFYTPCSAVSPC
jgi:hypothetical protein